jgi:sialic acid synthase SpsE
VRLASNHLFLANLNQTCPIMFVISEIFPQHGGSMAVAEQMILQSKLAGADAIKVQLYTATQFGAERA